MIIKEANLLKEYEKLTIRDHFMFGKICQDPDNCQIILRALLQSDINIVSSDTEKQIIEFSDNKFIRLDLLARDDKDSIYNAELQHKSTNTERQKELPKRLRYYQAMIDTTCLSSGKSYNELPESYIIFICTFDPFGKGDYIYPFEMKCTRYDDIEYNDYTHKIFLNTTAADKCSSQSLRNMLKYFETGVANDEATSHIEDKVIEARLKDTWRAEYMLSAVHDYDVYGDGFADGKIEGKSEGYALGNAEGYAIGKTEGYTSGKAEGNAEGQELFAKLINILLKENKIADAQRASTDSDYRNKLYEEYKIVDIND